LLTRLSFDLKLGGIGRHFDGVSDLADFKRDDPGRLSVRRIDHNARLDSFLKAGRLNCDGVSARLQYREREGAIRARLGLHLDILCGVGKSYLSAGYGITLGIVHHTAQACAGLSKTNDRKRKREEQR